ncbi:MAG: hypothetical protein V8R64_03660 [Thomasclavelia sp.]
MRYLKTLLSIAELVAIENLIDLDVNEVFENFSNMITSINIDDTISLVV